MVVFCILATLREAWFPQTPTWPPPPPSQCIKNDDAECVWEASTSVMHGPGRGPGILKRCMWPSSTALRLWCPPGQALGTTALRDGTWERSNAHQPVVSNENP